MENNPLVSVCIPTYNNPRGLKTTLKNIINQTYKNLEIIISDNASTDPNVKKTIDEFKDSRIRAFHQETNIGVDANYQFVFDRAKGKYFMFAQDDDQWSRGFIEKLVVALESTKAPVAISNVRYINIERQTLSPIHTLENISIYNVIGNGNIGFVCMGLWRRELYKKYLIRLPIHVLGGDHITVAHAMMATGSDIPVIHTELYLKGFKEGRFEVCFNNDFWYSFRSWYYLMKSLLWSPHIPVHRKIILPLVGFTNLMRACAVTGAQMVLKLPDRNIFKKTLKKHFFGAN